MGGRATGRRGVGLLTILGCIGYAPGPLGIWGALGFPAAGWGIATGGLGALTGGGFPVRRDPEQFAQQFEGAFEPFGAAFD